MNENVLDYMFKHKDAVIIESYGVGGIPSKPDFAYYDIVQEWSRKEKLQS